MSGGDGGWDDDASSPSHDAGDGDGDGDSPAEDAGSDAAVPVVCNPDDLDADKDGVTAEQGDCRDCDPLSKPGAYDIPGNGVDEDCNGKVDDEPQACDQGLAVDGDALAAAKALGLCRMQSGDSWGLVSARYVFPDGSTTSIGTSCPGSPPHPLSHGILTSFADHMKPREGSSLVNLSTGVARTGLHEVESPGYGTSPHDGYMCSQARPPAGFPATSSACPVVEDQFANTTWDAIALEVTIKVPSNAQALRFDFDFFSQEYPEFVCSGRNDHFVALLESKHASTPANKNISFDSMGNVPNVDSGFMSVCKPVTLNGRKFACPKGPMELEGTELNGEYGSSSGEFFTAGGSTSWLTTKAPVVPGETITLRFAIWDAQGGALDSTVLLDNFGWVVPEPSKPVVTEEPITEPVIIF